MHHQKVRLYWLSRWFPEFLENIDTWKIDEADVSQSDAPHQPERRTDFRECATRQSGLEVAAARCSGSGYGEAAGQAGAQGSRRYAGGERDRNNPAHSSNCNLD